MSSYQYRDSHVKDKTVSLTVLSLTWESPYLGKTVFILRRSITLIARFMVPTWGPSGADRTQVSPMLSPWTYLGSFEYFGKHLRSHYENWIDTPRQYMFPFFSTFSKSMVLCNASFLPNDDYFIPAWVCEENLYRERLCRDCFYWCVGWWAIWAIMEPPEGWESGGWFNIKMPSYQDRKSIVGMRRSYDCLTSTIWFTILVRWNLYIESGPCIWCCSHIFSCNGIIFRWIDDKLCAMLYLYTVI